MTDITTMRTHSAGMVYPLKDFKDTQSFPRKPQFDPRVSNSASAVIRGENAQRKFTDMKDSIQHATLINIVASVNNSEGKLRPPPTAETVQNTMNVISNLFLQRERHISIPKPQAFTEVPQKFSKKKPLFNKTSGNQATEKEIENRKRGSALSKPRPLSRDLETAPKQESIKIAVSLQKNIEDMNSSDGSRDWISSPSKVRSARSNSPRHRFVTLKKKHEHRTPTSISTCEAVDILDATESIVQAKPLSVSSNRDNVTSPIQDSNLYRAKSLPALFPVKRRKSTDTQSAALNERKHNIHPFKRSSIKAYGGMPNVVVGKPFQGKNGEIDEGNDDSSKPKTKPSTAVEHHLKLTHKDDRVREKSINQDNITLHGRSIPNPRPSSIQLPRYSKHPETDMLYSAFDFLDEKRITKQLDKQFDDLRKNISAKMSNVSDGGSIVSESSSDIASYNLVGKAFKSNLSSTSSVTKSGKQKIQKRVTFADDSEETSIVCDKSFQNFDTERALLNARLMQTKYQFKEKDRDFQEIKSMKTMSDDEVVCLKQKLMPGLFLGEPKHKNDILENTRISGMLVPSANARSSSRASDTNRSVVSEADTIGIEEAAKEWNGEDIDATNRDRTEVPLSQGASSFYPIAHEDDLDSCDTDEEFENMDSYRVLKAIDLGKLSNYQHRKFKNTSHKQEPSTTHFVKIKVK